MHTIAVDSTLDISIVGNIEVSTTQDTDIKQLQAICFPNIDEKEVEEDFYHPKSAHALAYSNDQLITWAGIHIAQTEFELQPLKIGGYGICTHPTHQGRGVAGKIVGLVMKYLNHQQCHIGFLSSEYKNIAAMKLHQKFGFVRLTQPFTWINSKGVIKSATDGMIAPLNSPDIFSKVLGSSTTLHVGNGYW